MYDAQYDLNFTSTDINIFHETQLDKVHHMTVIVHQVSFS